MMRTESCLTPASVILCSIVTINCYLHLGHVMLVVCRWIIPSSRLIVMFILCLYTLALYYC